jgi:hypothetical protein
VIVELKSFHLKERVEESECPLLRFSCHSQKTFARIHQPKVALGLLEKLVILQYRSQSQFHSQQTEIIHSKVHFTFQQANFGSVVAVNLPMAEKTSKALL